MGLNDSKNVESAAEHVGPAHGTAPAGHVRELDGIRAFAIWGVLVAHLIFAPAANAAQSVIPQPLMPVFAHAWLGVDLFFVLSGYLITGILLGAKHRGRTVYFRDFYLRRGLRIWPLYFIVLGVLWIVYGALATPYFTFCALFIANLAPGNWTVPDAAGPFWSLAVEEQFYLIWPWLVLWLDAKRLIQVALGVIIIELCARLGTRPDQIALTPLRADGLAMGALVAVWFAQRTRSMSAVRGLSIKLLAAAGAIAVFGFTLHRARPLSNASTTISIAICCFGALLVVAIAYRGHPLLSILRWRFAALTASLSYALYLVHMPVVDAWQTAFAAAPWFAALTPLAQTFVRAPIVLALCYGIALVTRRFIELPALRLGRAWQTPA